MFSRIRRSVSKQLTDDICRAHNRRRIGVATLVTLFAGLTLLASPFALLLVDKLLPLGNWERLSAIGQSYTGISALLSAGALVAVALSIRMQARQTDITQLLGTRELQHKVFELAFQDAVYASALSDAAEMVPEEHKLFRQNRFRTLHFRYIQFGFLSGELDEPGVRSHLSLEVFTSSAVRMWRKSARKHWENEASSAGHKRFVKIVNDEWQAAEERVAIVADSNKEPSQPQTVDDS